MARSISRSVVADVLSASDLGERDLDNARRHGVSVSSVRRWRRRRRQGHTDLQPPGSPCPRCDGSAVDAAAYAELFGWYLGDGYIVLGRRGVYLLQIYQDIAYPNDIARLQELISAVKPDARPFCRALTGCTAVSANWKHWPCLFPQHGRGRKHERRLWLRDWQQVIVTTHPGPFLRGLLHSDGSRVNNWARRLVAGAPKRYDYPRWQFVNASEDIRGFLCDALDQVEVPWRRSSPRTISVSTRAGVARLDELVGLKS